MFNASTSPSSRRPNFAQSRLQPFITRSISGTFSGLLDPSQPARVLQHPSNTLSFVLSELPSTVPPYVNGEERRLKRVAIEMTPVGENFWRIVPDARLEGGCVDEGTWPRVVEICGEPVECSLDQWDIYKLDPAYECLVRKPPNPSVISRIWAPSDPPAHTKESYQGQPVLVSVQHSGRHRSNDMLYLCAACLYLISCLALVSWMLVSGPKLVPRQDTRITNILISLGARVALGLALWIIAVRLRTQWTRILVSGRSAQLRGLLAACGPGGSISRVRHLRTAPTVGLACTAIVGAAVTLLMTTTSAGFKYVLLPGTAWKNFTNPDVEAICNFSLVTNTTGYFCTGLANAATVTTEWNYLDIVNSRAGGNVVVSSGLTVPMSANVSLTSAPANLRLPSNKPPPWAAIDVNCRAAELQLTLVGNGTDSSNIVYIDGREWDHLSVAEMPSWNSQVQLYQQVNDSGPASSLSPWYVVLLARDVNDGTAHTGGLSGTAVSFLGNAYLDLHGVGVILQGILGAAAYCSFSGSTGGDWPSGTWPWPSTTNVVVGTQPRNGVIEFSTLFLNYGPSWQYNPVSENSIPSGSVSYIANWTNDATNFPDFIARYMRNQWALMTYTNNYISGFVANTSYEVKIEPQLYIQATAVLAPPMVALVVCICFAGVCIWTVHELGYWHERIDMSPWWLLKATGPAWPMPEGRLANNLEFETWSSQVQCVYASGPHDANAGRLVFESTATL